MEGDIKTDTCQKPLNQQRHVAGIGEFCHEFQRISGRRTLAETHSSAGCVGHVRWMFSCSTYLTWPSNSFGREKAGKLCHSPPMRDILSDNCLDAQPGVKTT